MQEEDIVYNEMIKWKTASINVELKLKEPCITIYVQIEIATLSCLQKFLQNLFIYTQEMPISHLVNGLFGKDIDDITHNDLTPSNKYESVTTRQRSSGLYRFSQGVKVVGKWLGRTPDTDQRNRVYEHPFMSSVSDLYVDIEGTSYWTHWSEDEEQYQNNICWQLAR